MAMMLSKKAGLFAILCNNFVGETNMKYFITLLALSAACLFVTGCESIEYVRLEKYTMHGNDTIVPTKPVKDPKYIKEFPARQAFKAVPNDILNKYYDKIPEDTRKYNLAKQNISIAGTKVTQDEITLNFITAVVDYELKKIKYQPNRQLVEYGVKRSDLPLPELKTVDQNKLFKSRRVSMEDKRNFNILRKKHEGLSQVDAIVKNLFKKCGLNETDIFWFKKFAILKYEFIGSTWTMHQANEKMREAL